MLNKTERGPTGEDQTSPDTAKIPEILLDHDPDIHEAASNGDNIRILIDVVSPEAELPEQL